MRAMDRRLARFRVSGEGRSGAGVVRQYYWDQCPHCRNSSKSSGVVAEYITRKLGLPYEVVDVQHMPPRLHGNGVPYFEMQVGERPDEVIELDRDPVKRFRQVINLQNHFRKMGRPLTGGRNIISDAVAAAQHVASGISGLFTSSDTNEGSGAADPSPPQTDSGNDQGGDDGGGRVGFQGVLGYVSGDAGIGEDLAGRPSSAGRAGDTSLGGPGGATSNLADDRLLLHRKNIRLVNRGAKLFRKRKTEEERRARERARAMGYDVDDELEPTAITPKIKGLDEALRADDAAQSAREMVRDLKKPLLQTVRNHRPLPPMGAPYLNAHGVSTGMQAVQSSSLSPPAFPTAEPVPPGSPSAKGAALRAATDANQMSFDDLIQQLTGTTAPLPPPASASGKAPTSRTRKTSSSRGRTASRKSSTAAPLTATQLRKKTKAQLVKLATQQGVDATGTKEDIIQRLLA